MTERKARAIPETLTDALYELVHHSAVPAKVQSDTLGLAISTLNNAANGSIEGARFQAAWLVPLTNLTGNFIALDIIERLTGRVAVKVDAQLPDGVTLQDEALRVTKELGDACEAIRKALDPKGPRGAAMTGDEKARLKKETYELLQEAARLWKLAEGL